MRSRIRPQADVTLSQRIIYILPTRSGLLFLLAVAVIFVAAINYAVSLAFGLAFLMVSIFVLSILHTWNNLNRLQLKAMPTVPVFCGDEIAFNLEVSRSLHRKHEALELFYLDAWSARKPSPECPMIQLDLVDADREQVKVIAPAKRRGNYKAPLLCVSTTYPLGLARAWSVVDLDQLCLVYPRPIAFHMSQFNSGGGGNDDSAISRRGTEDFYGLREYVPGDPLKQVAWKAVARGQGMQVKEFVDYVDSRIWLDWDMFYGFSVEERLSRLCYCVLQLAKTDNPYGLKMPAIEIPPASGAAHKTRLLRTLALFGEA